MPLGLLWVKGARVNNFLVNNVHSSLPVRPIKSHHEMKPASNATLYASSEYSTLQLIYDA